MKKLLLLLLALVAAAIAWGVLRKNEPPHINFARVKRQTLISTLPTNGKVEPFEWQAARSEATGLVSRVDVHEGGTVSKGATLAVMTDPSLQGDIEAAQARVSEARANLAVLEGGLKPSELTEIENNLARARMDLQQQTTEYETLRRLAQKNAATTADVNAANDNVHELELAIKALENRKTSQVSKPEVAAAQARLEDAQSALRLAQQRAALSVVRAPLTGVVYGLAVQPGAYLSAGDLVANVGLMNRLRVRVYVDEPELGRVKEGQPVTIAWQAMPGRKWDGTVERKPTSIQALGSRQVGEVICTIENAARELIPGTNVDAEIRTAVVDRALVVPREAMRHDAAGDYVLALKGDLVERRTVKAGASSISQVQVAEGLGESDAVALPSDIPLKPGDRVAPAFDSHT